MWRGPAAARLRHLHGATTVVVGVAACGELGAVWWTQFVVQESPDMVADCMPSGNTVTQATAAQAHRTQQHYGTASTTYTTAAATMSDLERAAAVRALLPVQSTRGARTQSCLRNRCHQSRRLRNRPWRLRNQSQVLRRLLQRAGLRRAARAPSHKQTHTPAVCDMCDQHEHVPFMTSDTDGSRRGLTLHVRAHTMHCAGAQTLVHAQHARCFAHAFRTCTHTSTVT